MSRAILKWTVPVDDQEHRIGPGPVTLVGCQHGWQGGVQIWTDERDRLVNPVGAGRSVRVVGTGHPIPDEATVLGSVVDGGFVWHVIEVPA